MKLYLTSYRVPELETLLNLLDKRPAEAKVAFIANAKDFYIDRARKVKTNATKEYLKSLGFKNIAELDLRKHRSAKQLKKTLGRIDLLWVGGGNTFNLMEQVVESGLDKIIRSRIEGGMVYAGESAGAVIAGKNLQGIEPDDEPGFAEKVHFKGLGLIDKFILPHADNKFFADSTELSEQIYKPGEVIKINDNQALVVDGSKQKIVGGNP